MISEKFIEECKNRANANRLGKIIVDGMENPITNSDNLQSFSIDSGCYVNGNIIGSVYAKCLKASFITDIADLSGKTTYAQIGVKYDDSTTEYIKMGKYTVERPNNEITANMSQITAYDDLYTNLDNQYVCGIDYSKGNVTVKDLYIDVCKQLGLTPKTTSFLNDNISIENNPFTNKEKNRTILQTIGKISCSFIDIDVETNEIDLCWVSQSEEPDYIFYKNDYASVEGGQVVCGPINCLIIKNSQIDSENVTIKDDEDIALNGEHSITISEDYILHNEELRQQAITNIWNRVHGMKYVDCKLTTYYGKPFMKLGTRIRIYIDDDNTQYIDTYVLKHNFTYDGSFNGIIESPALTQQEIKVKQDISLGEALKNTQIDVDKQNQKIESVVSDVNNQNEKISQVTQTVDEINQKIQNIADITVSDVTLIGHLELNGINESEPINIIIRPLGEDISYLYPHSNLFPSENLYIKTRTLRFHNKTTKENIDYELPEDLLYYDSDTYSEFRLDYDTQTCEVVKRVEYNEDGTKSPIATKINPYPYPPIRLTDGDYEISLLGYNSAYLSVRLMASNIYTSQFATRIELKSSITQTENSINQMVQAQITGVDNKITDVKGEVSLKLNIKDLFSEFNVNVNQIVINSDNFKVSREGNITANSGNIGGFVLNSTSFSKKISGLYDYDYFDLLGARYAILNDITINDPGFYPYDTNGDGKIGAMDLLDIRKKTLGQETINKTVSGSFEINSNNPKYCVAVKDHNNNLVSYMGLNGINSTMISCENLISSTSNTDIYVTINGKKGIVSATNGVNQGSREEIKKNFEKFTGALKIIDDIDLYKYNFKNEEDNHKKHIGFVIGNNYKYSSEITAIDESGKEIGVDLYSMASLCLEAIKELYEIIKEEKNEK